MALNYTPINPPQQTSVNTLSSSVENNEPIAYDQYDPVAMDQADEVQSEISAATDQADVVEDKAKNLQKQAQANAATATSIASGNIAVATETPLDASSILTFCPDDMPFGSGKTNNWAPIINGIQINRVQYKISEPTAGMRVDILPQLQFHYPMLRAQGYELTQFTMDLFAWDQDSFNELQQILNSVIPPVFPFGNKKQAPKITTISYPALDARQLNKWIPIKPSTSFLAWDQDQMGHPCKFTFLQWIPASFQWRDPELLNAQQLPMPRAGHSESAANFIQD